MFTALRISRLVSFLLLLLLAAIIAYWAGLLLAPRSAVAPSSIGAASEPSASNQWTSQLFGAKQVAPVAGPATPAASSNLLLQGLITGARAAAVISVDGKPAKPFELGQEVQPGLKLVEVSAKRVVLEQNGVRSELKAPPNSSPAVLTSKDASKATSASTPPPSTASPIPAPPASTTPSPAFGAAAQAPAPAPAPVGAPSSPPEPSGTQATNASQTPTTRLRGPLREPVPGAPVGQPQQP